MLPKFGPVAHGTKHKMTLNVTNVTLCKHSETLAPFIFLLPSRNDQKLQTPGRNKLLKIFGIVGKQTFSTGQAFHVIEKQLISLLIKIH